MNQAEPLPFLPSLPENDDLKAALFDVGRHWASLKEWSFHEMYNRASGFRDLKPEQRLASYLKWGLSTGIPDPVQGLMAFLSTPVQIPTMQVDELGMPMQIPPMSLMQLSSTECAWMLSDAAKLFQKAQEKAIEQQALAMEQQALMMGAPVNGAIP